jgi:ABC-2 type transport system permease protein
MANRLLHEVRLLLKPRTLPLLRRRWPRSGRGGGRLIVLGIVGTLFWWGLFGISWRVLRYFKGIEDIGDLLAYKLLSMILVVSFALLLFSGILTALARLFLSRDLSLVHSLPVAHHRIFIARWIDSTADSSWMVIVFTLPVFLAYGMAFNAGAAFYAGTLLAMVLLAVIASALSALVVMAGVMIVPATRMRSVVLLMGVLLFVVLYLAIRLMRPEQLVDPEVFDSVLVYISSLQAPAAPFLPSTWAGDSIQAALAGTLATSSLHLALSASFAVFVFCLAVITADAIYFKGFSKAQTAAAAVIRRRGVSERIFRFFPRPVRAFAVKEVKTFLRDQTQWTQLFLIAALLVIYIYNFDALP